RDSLLAFQHRYDVPLAVALNIGLPLLLGILSHDVWGMLILAGVLRLVWSHHITFFINSLAHMWGSRPYTDENTARDNPVIAVVTYGEGYHNFHHIFAHDYRNGVRWWQWDLTKWLIAGLQVVGLTRRLKRTPVFQIQRALLAMPFTRARQCLASNRHAGCARPGPAWPRRPRASPRTSPWRRRPAAPTRRRIRGWGAPSRTRAASTCRRTR